MALPYVKQTWIDDSPGGTPLSASRLTVIEQGITDAHYMPACRVYTTTSTAGALQAFANESWDTASNLTDSQHDNSVNNSRLTCRYPGVYVITGSQASNPVTITGMAIYINGSMVIQDTGSANLSMIYKLSANDYAELWCTGGANSTVYFSWVRVG